MAVTAKISKSGQVTIPASIRASLGVKPGDTLIWRVDEHGGASVKPVKYTLNDMDGILGLIPEGMTLQDVVEEAVAEGMDRRFRRGPNEEVS